MELKPSSKWQLYTLFALSGFCALVYEVLWTKYLSLIFGTTMPAVSIVAATFMGGLALGSFLIGRLADREANLLRLYAFLEFGIAIFALLSRPGLNLVEGLYATIINLFPDLPLLTHALHFGIGAALLIPPTLCMGGTFPLMCRFFARKKSGGQIGRLYAMNTFGATLGAFGSGYVLIPSIGLSSTLYLAVICNILIAVVSLMMSKKMGQARHSDASASNREQQPLEAKQHLFPLTFIGLIGFCSLAYEILWTRVLLLFLGNTTYAFSLILTAFLIGIAAGGAVYARKVHKELNEKTVITQLTLLMGLSVAFTLPLYDRLPHIFLQIHALVDDRWWLLSLTSLLVTLAIIGLPALLSGSLLPATVALIDPGRLRTGEGVGLVVLFNTVGAVLGSLVAGFALVPLAGVQGSFRLLCLLNLLLGLALLIRYRPGMTRRRISLALCSIGIFALFYAPPWNQELMNSGVYIYAQKYLQMGGLEKILENERLIEVFEGRDATVALHESTDGQFRFFSVNGKTDGGNAIDMGTQLLVGHLPMLLHPNPKHSLVIGLGTGITLRGLSGYPVETIDCVEISPEVVEASHYFREENGNALNDPKIRLAIEDGRNLLQTRDTHYDVIISEPSNPWQAGNSNLFTAEFYRLARKRLNPQGLFCQWVGLYDITSDNLRTAANTFLSVFPHAMVFRAGSDLILVGGEDPLTFDFTQVKERMQRPVVREALKLAQIHCPSDLLARYYLYNEEPLRQIARGAPLNTDDLPRLEFSARFNLGEKTLGALQSANVAMLTEISDKVSLPVVNLGENNREISQSLQILSQGYARAGRDNVSDYLRKTALNL